MKTIILAGGFGTRLQEIIKDVPKPMARIAGKPFLEHQINFIKQQGLEDIILSVHYKSNVIKSYFGDGTRFGVNITYSEEDTPLGTGGAIKLAEKYIKDNFFVLNGDSYSDVNFKDFAKFHEDNGSLYSIILTNVDESSAYGNVKLEGNKVINFSEKNSEARGLVNGGIYLFSPEIFDYIPEKRKISLEREIFPEIISEKKMYGMIHKGYFMDIGRPETYNQFRQDFLKRLQSGMNLTVREAMEKIEKNNTDILLIKNQDEKFVGVLNNKIIRKFLIDGGNANQNVQDAMITEPHKIGRNDDDKRNYEILCSGTRHLPILDKDKKIVDIRFYDEDIKMQSFPIVRGKSPLRISFGGGGTDIPYFFEKYGGSVISSTIDKYCYATAAKRADSKIIIESDLEENEVILDTNNLKYDGKFDIVKAVYNILKPDFGLDLYLHNDVPPRRGLGSSASFAVLLTKIFGNLMGREYNDEMLAETAYKAEVEKLEIVGGKQDQYAAVFGGFNWMEFENGDKKIMHPLRIRENTIEELLSHLTLCYTGSPHYSKKQQSGQEKIFRENEKEMVGRFQEIKNLAINIKENLLSARPNFEKIGESFRESWENKKKLSPNITNEKVDALYNTALENGIYGGKLLGSGGGGYLLFFHNPKNKIQLRRNLENIGGEILDFSFETKGVKTWYVDK